MNKYKKIFRYSRLIFYLAFFLAFVFIPTTYFESHSICISYNILHILCPTCGVTRAFSSILHFHIIDAYSYNPVFTLAICPIALIVIFQDIYTIIKDMINKKETYSLFEHLFKI